MDFREESLREKYSRIISQHPREKDLKVIDKVNEFLKNANKNGVKEFFSIREILKELLGEDERAVRRSIKKLNDAEIYLDVFRKGSRFVYFAVERFDGTFDMTIPIWESERIEEIKNENFDMLINFYEAHTNLLDEKILLELERVRSSRDTERPNWTAYNILVQNIWDEGFDEFLKLSIRSGAKRYSAK